MTRCDRPSNDWWNRININTIWRGIKSLWTILLVVKHQHPQSRIDLANNVVYLLGWCYHHSRQKTRNKSRLCFQFPADFLCPTSRWNRVKPTLFPAPSEEKSGPRRPGLSFKSDNSFLVLQKVKLVACLCLITAHFPLLDPLSELLLR